MKKPEKFETVELKTWDRAVSHVVNVIILAVCGLAILIDLLHSKRKKTKVAN